MLPALIGFDTTQTVAFYGFASNGGIVNFQNTSVDFSGGSLVFPVQNTSKANMPELVLTLSQKEEILNTQTKINIGGENLYVSNVKNVSKLVVPVSSLKSPFSNAELTANKEGIAAFLMQAVPVTDDGVYKAIRTDPGLILSYNKKNWRVPDYEVFEWDRYDRILFFDTADYEIQNDFFRRLAYLQISTGTMPTTIRQNLLQPFLIKPQKKIFL